MPKIALPEEETIPDTYGAIERRRFRLTYANWIKVNRKNELGRLKRNAEPKLGPRPSLL